MLVLKKPVRSRWEPIRFAARPTYGGAVMIAMIGLVGFMIVTALVEWLISAQVWQGSDMDDLSGDEDDSSTNRPLGITAHRQQVA